MFKPGDIVEIISQDSITVNWVGYRGEVIYSNDYDLDGVTRIKPIEPRPDGYKTTFTWRTSRLKKVEPAEPDYLNMILDITDCISQGDSIRLQSVLLDCYTEVWAYNKDLTSRR